MTATWQTRLAAACVFAILAPSALADTATFQHLGAGGYSTMSRNGQYVLLRQSNNDITRWSASSGQVPIGLNVGTNGFVTGVSDDGAIIIGTHRNASNVSTAFRWTAAGGFVDLGDLPGGSTFSDAFGMSADGNTIIGQSASTASGTRPEAYKWTPATGMVALGDISGGTYYSNANAVSADGSVIVGTSNQTQGYEAFRWTSAGGMQGLGDIPGGFFNSQAYAISSDGNTIAGYSTNTLNQEETFKWTTEAGMQALGIASSDPNEWSQGHAVSNGGNLVVGNNNTGATLADIKAIEWDPVHGMRHLQEALLADYGISLPGWRLNGAWNVSDDGRIIAGAGTNPSNVSEAWVVTTVPEPSCALVLCALMTMEHRRRLPCR